MRHRVGRPRWASAMKLGIAAAARMLRLSILVVAPIARAYLQPGSVVFTMVLGVCLGLISSVVWAVGTRIIYAMANPSVASPSVGLELYWRTHREHTTRRVSDGPGYQRRAEEAEMIVSSASRIASAFSSSGKRSASSVRDFSQTAVPASVLTTECRRASCSSRVRTT